jgi:hypothetical protein
MFVTVLLLPEEVPPIAALQVPAQVTVPALQFAAQLTDVGDCQVPYEHAKVAEPVYPAAVSVTVAEEPEAVAEMPPLHEPDHETEPDEQGNAEQLNDPADQTPLLQENVAEPE